MSSNREVKLIVSALVLVSASAFANRAPDPPFYVYDASQDFNGLITQPSCTSVDGNIPAFATIPGGNIEGVVMAAQSNATNAGISPPCSVGSSFTNTATSAGIGSVTDTGNTMTLSTTDNIVPSYSPAFGTNWAGASGAAYVQQFYAAPGTQINLSVTINGNGYVYVAVVSPCPDPSVTCTVGATGATASYGGISDGPPTAKNEKVNLPAFTVSSSGRYVVGIEVITGSQYPFPYYQGSLSISVTFGCGVAQPFPAPPDGSVFNLSGWSFGYSAGDPGGLAAVNVLLGVRQMAQSINVPYFNLRTSDFNQTRCVLQNNGSGSGSPCSSTLVDFQRGASSAKATYLVNNIPPGTASCLEITEQFTFNPPVAGDRCDATSISNLFPCARFFPTVSYQYLPDDPSKHIQEIDLPIRLWLSTQNLASPTGLASQSTAIAKDSNTLPVTNLFDGNPMVTEAFIPGVIANGMEGAADGYYQTYISAIDQPGALPLRVFPLASNLGICPTCMAVRWRWSTLLQSSGGQPFIPSGSTQSVDVAIVAYPDDYGASSCSSLASGKAITGISAVFWYCGKGNQDNDTFFSHGGFYNILPPGLIYPDINLIKSGFRLLNPGALFTQTVTLTNNSSSPVSGPLAVVLNSVSSNAKLANADGMTGTVTPLGSPYVLAPLGGSSQLAPGQSLTMVLEFTNPTKGAITYSTQVVGGGLP